jgi:hypothetical protein
MTFSPLRFGKHYNTLAKSRKRLRRMTYSITHQPVGQAFSASSACLPMEGIGK